MVWYNPTTWGNEMQPLPIQVNPGNANALARHVGRLVNLFAAQKRDDAVAIRQEIKQRQAAIAQYGHVAPQNEDEARELFSKVKGD